MTSPPRKQRGRPRVAHSEPALNTTTSRHHSAGHSDRKALAEALGFPGAVPVMVDQCADCAARTEDTPDGPRLSHQDGCPIAAGLDADEVDQRWFADHPFAQRYRRPAQPSEITAMRLQGIALGSRARVEVLQIEPGLRVRTFQSFGQVAGFSVDQDGPGRAETST